MRIAGVNPPGDHRAEDRDDRADREIDPLGADHDRHAERDDRRRHGAVEDVDQVAEQSAFDDPDGEESGRDEAVDREDQRQRDERPNRAMAASARIAKCARAREVRRLRLKVRARSHVRAPAIVRMMFSRVISPPPISPTFRRSRSTTIRSLTATSSSSSEDATSSARPCGAKLPDQRHDLGVRADVDAARRLVENENARSGDQRRARAPPSADCRPTVGRPACPRPGVAIASALIISCASRSCSSCGEPPQPPAFGLQPEHDVLAHGEFAEDAFGLAVLRTERHADDAATAPARARRSGPPTSRRPESGRMAPKTSLATSVRPEPRSPASPTTSPGRSDRSNGAMTRRRPSPSATRIGSPSARGPKPASRSSVSLELATEHQRDQLQRRKVGGRADADEPAVAQAPRCGRRSGRPGR